MLYRLKKRAGGHSQGGRVYVAGDVIDSEEDLIQKFSGKFEKVHRDEVEVSEGTPEIGPDIPTPASVKGESTGDDGAKPESSPESETASINDAEKPEPEVESEYGKDVTHLFPAAGELDMKVFIKTHWYTVIDTEDGKVLNEKKLREKDVQSFLESYADAAEEGDD